MSDASRGARNHKAEAQASYKAEVKAAKASTNSGGGWYQNSRFWVLAIALVVIVLLVTLAARG